MTEEIDIDLHEKQQEIVDKRGRFNVIRCGRRFGKSHLAFALALEAMVSIPNAKVLYTAPSVPELRGRYDEASEYFRQLGAECKWGQIKLENSVLTMSGIWRADALRGNKYHRLIGDEWAYCPNAENDWNFVLSPMLTDYKGDAYFFSTPKGKNHFAEIDTYQDKYEDWKSFHYSTYDNPLIDPEEVDRQREVLPSLVFAQEYLAEYVDRDAAKIKREWLRISNTMVCKSYYIGVDLAISEKDTADYTAVCVIGITENKEIVIVEIVRGRWSFVEIGKKVVEMEMKWKPRVVAVESNQAQAWLVQELKRNTKMNVVGIPSTKDKLYRFQPVEAKYEAGLVYHVPHLLPEFTDELLSFTGTKQDKHDDMIDSLSMAFAAIRKTPSVYV
ncbi:MAG: phage terminase large subunit [Methylophilaceae bacterium]